MVEFALIAPVFFFLIFGLIEIAVMFIFMNTLDYGINETARRIRTGELQTAGADASDFKELLCGNLFDLLDCDDNLWVDVDRFDDFQAADASDNALPIDDDGNLIDDFDYDPGGPSEIVLVQAYYKWDLITPVLPELLNPALSNPLINLGDRSRLLRAAAVFRNEPY